MSLFRLSVNHRVSLRPPADPYVLSSKGFRTAKSIQLEESEKCIFHKMLSGKNSLRSHKIVKLVMEQSNAVRAITNWINKRELF